MKHLILLIQIGSTLWINPELVQFLTDTEEKGCYTRLFLKDVGAVCSDWPLKTVLSHLLPVKSK